jgi:translation initiation factor eIF-2B subunit delta
MPVPTIADPPQTGAKPPGQPSQKTMTKAERRELQEKQRAAKSALKAQPLQQQGKTQAKPHQQAVGGAPGHPKPKAPPTPLKKIFGAEVTGAKQSASKDPVIGAIGEDASAKQASHGLRIFSHFGQPKPVGHAVKGDIHPAIIRLGLLFSEFKICGANARCIAMLLAFKQAGLFYF